MKNQILKLASAFFLFFLFILFQNCESKNQIYKFTDSDSSQAVPSKQTTTTVSIEDSSEDENYIEEEFDDHQSDDDQNVVTKKDFVVIGIGQSNMSGYFRHENWGKNYFESNLNSPKISGKVQFINASFGGSALLQENVSPHNLENFWVSVDKN